MDNDAFRALVNQRRQNTSSTKSNNGEKSSREIAREAVQEEFRRKKQGGGGGGGGRRSKGRGGGGGDGEDDDGGYGSSSDEEGPDAAGTAKNYDEPNEPEWKRRRKEKKQSSNPQQPEYRDRAKERREGNNVDYASMEVMASNANEEAEDRQRQAELSKYLGGDEEHTHLVKGLDLALAQKVRREEMGEDAYGDFGEGTGDLDQLLEESYAQKQKQSQLDNKSSTPKNTGDLQTLNPQSELGTSMLSYLLRQQQSKSFSSTSTLLSNNIKINSAIQKSFLTFSLESDVRRRKTAWEVPRVSIQVMISRHGGADNDQSSQKATPLDHQLLVSISNALSGSKRLRGERSKEGNRKKGRVQFNGEGMHGSKKNNDHAGEKEGKDAGDDNSNITTGSNAKAEPKKEVDDDDSDDDIFENVGTYVPEKSNESKTANEGDTEDGSSNKIEDAHKNIAGSSEVDHQQKKQSIFENLVTPSDQPAPNNTQHHHQHRKIQQLSPTRKNKNIIDRNIFGGASDSQHNAESSLNKRRGPVSAAMEGVSMTNYRGGYGEEMDVDFGNFDEDDQEQNSEKEKDAQGGKAGGDEEE